VLLSSEIEEQTKSASSTSWEATLLQGQRIPLLMLPTALTPPVISHVYNPVKEKRNLSQGFLLQYKF
jgi:peroxiredoxin